MSARRRSVTALLVCGALAACAPAAIVSGDFVAAMRAVAPAKHFGFVGAAIYGAR